MKEQQSQRGRRSAYKYAACRQGLGFCKDKNGKQAVDKREELSGYRGNHGCEAKSNYEL